MNRITPSVHSSINEQFYDAHEELAPANSSRPSVEMHPVRHSTDSHHPASEQTVRQHSSNLSSAFFLGRQPMAENALTPAIHSSEHVTGTLQITGFNYEHPNQAALHHKLASLYEKHISGDNYYEFHLHISALSLELHELGETPADVESVITKGVNLNRLAQIGRGGVMAIPFAVSSLALDHIPILSAFATHPAVAGMNAGLQAALADTFGCTLLHRMGDNVMWMHAEPHNMVPVMQEAAAHRQPSKLRQAGEYTLLIQAYTVRNLVRLGTAATVAALAGPETAAIVDSNLSAAGGIVAGSVMGLTSYAVDQAKGRTGPEYMFSRYDWQEKYLALKNTTVISGPVMGALKRTAKLPLDVLTDTPRALRALASSGSIGKTVVLAGGFGGVLWARAAVSAAMGSGTFTAASILAMNHLVNVVAAMPVYGLAPAVEIMGDTIGDKLSNAVHAMPGAIYGSAAWAALKAQEHLNLKLMKTT